MGIPEDIQAGEGITAVAVVAVLVQLLLTPHLLREVEDKEYLMIMSLHLLYHHCLFIFHNFLINRTVWILCIIHLHDIFLEPVLLLDRSTHTNLILIFTNIRIYHHYPHIFKVILISNKYRLRYHLIF